MVEAKLALGMMLERRRSEVVEHALLAFTVGRRRSFGAFLGLWWLLHVTVLENVALGDTAAAFLRFGRDHVVVIAGLRVLVLGGAATTAEAHA